MQQGLNIGNSELLNNVFTDAPVHIWCTHNKSVHRKQLEFVVSFFKETLS